MKGTGERKIGESERSKMADIALHLTQRTMYLSYIRRHYNIPRPMTASTVHVDLTNNFDKGAQLLQILGAALASE